MIARQTHLRVQTLEDRTVPSLTPAGPEFQVNTVTTEFQRPPAVAVDADGDFVVAWQGYDQESFTTTGFGISFRRYAPDGTVLGPETPVADTGDFVNVNVVGNDAGQFVIYWDGWLGAPGASPEQVYARVYDVNAQPLGPSFRVNQSTSTYDGTSDAAMLANGDFVFSWQERATSTALPAVVSRLYHADGTPATSTIVVSTDTNFENHGSTIAASRDGSFFVAWLQYTSTGSISSTNYGYVRNFDSLGQPLTPPTLIDPSSSSGRMDDLEGLVQSSGELILFWNGRTPPSGSPAVNNLYMRRFDSDCAPVGAVELLMPGEHGDLNAGLDAQDNFVLSWVHPIYFLNGIYLIGYSADIYARSYHADGTADGSEFLVNSYTSTDFVPYGGTSNRRLRTMPALAVDPDGDAMFVWASFAQVTNGQFDVFAQRYAGPAPKNRGIAVNNGVPQRSVVKSTDLGFNRTLTLPSNPAAAFVLNGPTGQLPVTIDASGGTVAGSNLKVNFPNLPDGQYTLRMLAAQVTDSAGQHLDGNGDGIPGDDFITSFHKLTGDFNGDAHVDAADFLMFRLAFLSNNLTFDLDGDGVVDGNDFLRFRVQFLLSV